MGGKVFYIEEVAEGTPIPPLQKRPSTRQLAMYAGASGDFYEIHYDHHFALQAGLPDGVIVHGMLSMAWLGQLLTDWLPPLSLRKLEVRFRAMARPGDLITCSGRVTRKFVQGDQQMIECEIEARSQRGEVTSLGTALAALPTRA